MAKRQKTRNYLTQWAGQYAAAAELTRRGYLVAFTLGNAPVFDLLCQPTSGGAAFGVQVKSLSSKGYFPISDLYSGEPSDFFILVYVPPNVKMPIEFYVATREELQQASASYVPSRRRLPEGQAHAAFPSGVQYQAISKFKDRWNALPNVINETANSTGS